MCQSLDTNASIMSTTTRCHGLSMDVSFAVKSNIDIINEYTQEQNG